MNKILIVEDEMELAHLIQDYLRHAQFNTHITTDGNQVIDDIASFTPDLILLDLMLPNKDGLTICKEIRAIPSTIPIIITTAKIEEIDRLLGLELGADDYICKPYSPREVVARVKAVLRRTSINTDCLETQTDQHKTNLTLNEEALSVSIHGTLLPLTLVEFRLLQALSNEPRRVFTREQLMNRIYNDHRVVNDRTIDSHITKLRKKLSAANAGDDVIRSVYGVGYKYEAPIA